MCLCVHITHMYITKHVCVFLGTFMSLCIVSVKWDMHFFYACLYFHTCLCLTIHCACIPVLNVWDYSCVCMSCICICIHEVSIFSSVYVYVGVLASLVCFCTVCICTLYCMCLFCVHVCIMFMSVLRVCSVCLSVLSACLLCVYSPCVFFLCVYMFCVHVCVFPCVHDYKDAGVQG